MPKITFVAGYGGYRTGFAPVTPQNVQKAVIQYCKETFSRQLVGWQPGLGGRGREALEVSKRGTVKFLYTSRSVPMTPEFAAHKAAILQVFDKAMGFKPLAKCQVVVNGRRSYLFFEVSASWAKSHPVAHILAVLVRNQYPVDEIMEWPEIVAWLIRRGKFAGAREAVYEIIASKGAVREVGQVNGIQDYGFARAQQLENVRRAAQNEDWNRG